MYVEGKCHGVAISRFAVISPAIVSETNHKPPRNGFIFCTSRINQNPYVRTFSKAKGMLACQCRVQGEHSGEGLMG